MASFYGNIDLMKLKGAKLLTGLDEKKKDRVYVCIPVAWSEIKTTQDAQGNTHARLSVNLWETGAKYRQACIAGKQARGEDVSNYIPPSHQMEVGYSEDFRTKAEEAARKRLLKEHPDWSQPEHAQELKNAIYNAVRVRLGTISAHVAKEQRASVATAVQGVSGYTPQQTEGADGQVQGAADPNDPFANDDYPDDLPF